MSYLLLYSHSRLSSVSVLFDFNDSLNDFTPLSPISFSFDVKIKAKSELLMDFICMSYLLLSSPLRLSFVSVVFDFNDSLNDVAPVSPILLPIGYYGNL